MNTIPFQQGSIWAKSKILIPTKCNIDQTAVVSMFVLKGVLRPSCKVDKLDQNDLLTFS